MSDILKLVDGLPDEELLKLNSELDALESQAARHAKAANIGRQMAHGLAKHSAVMATSIERSMQRVAFLRDGLEKVAAEGGSPMSELFVFEAPEGADLEKLASPEHYRRYGKTGLLRLMENI